MAKKESFNLDETYDEEKTEFFIRPEGKSPGSSLTWSYLAGEWTETSDTRFKTKGATNPDRLTTTETVTTIVPTTVVLSKVEEEEEEVVEDDVKVLTILNEFAFDGRTLTFPQDHDVSGGAKELFDARVKYAKEVLNGKEGFEFSGEKWGHDAREWWGEFVFDPEDAPRVRAWIKEEDREQDSRGTKFIEKWGHESGFVDSDYEVLSTDSRLWTEETKEEWTHVLLGTNFKEIIHPHGAGSRFAGYSFMLQNVFNGRWDKQREGWWFRKQDFSAVEKWVRDPPLPLPFGIDEAWTNVDGPVDEWHHPKNGKPYKYSCECGKEKRQVKRAGWYDGKTCEECGTTITEEYLARLKNGK